MKIEELRELDAWIAENVMGFKKASRFEGGELLGSRGQKSNECRWLSNDDPKYTTNPAAAMEVLKKCGQETYPYQLQIEIQENGSVNISGGGFRQPYRITASTLELAICLFAEKLFNKNSLPAVKG
jgi:hypothetical protein